MVGEARRVEEVEGRAGALEGAVFGQSTDGIEIVEVDGELVGLPNITEIESPA